jgi:predicted nucleotidyltransferase
MRTLDETVLDDAQRDVLRRAKEAITAVLPTAEILLYGSTARGTRSQDSDYDILVILRQALTPEQRNAVYLAMLKVELETEAPLSTHFVTREKWEKHQYVPFFLEIRKDAVQL